MILTLAVIIVTSVWIMLACNPFEDAADYLGRNLGAGIKGATINAVGSSLPELFVTVLFLFVFKNEDAFASGIATTAGSAVFNAAVIPAVVLFSVFFLLKKKSIEVEKSVIRRDGIFYVISIIAFLLLIKQPLFTWWMGALLILIYVGYAGFLIISNKSSESVEEDNEEDDEPSDGNRLKALVKFDFKTLITGGKEFNTFTAWSALILATLHIGAACYFLTESVIELGVHWNIPVFIVAVIIAAAATSIPDTILSVKDALKGNYEDAMSNAIGSNIFDICIGLGLPVLVYTLINGPLLVSQEATSGILELIVMLLGITAIVLGSFLIPKSVGLKTAVLLLGAYLFYVVYAISSGKGMEWTQGISSAINGLLGA